VRKREKGRKIPAFNVGIEGDSDQSDPNHSSVGTPSNVSGKVFQAVVSEKLASNYNGQNLPD
jgi:hypothetical protein